MIDERYLLPSEKPWAEDPHAQPRPEAKPDDRGPLERERRILTINVASAWVRLNRWLRE